MAVDYAAKNAERDGQAWALRNAKLRFSRKLLYLAGLLLAFETSLFPESDLIPSHSSSQLVLFDTAKPDLSSTEHCLYASRLTPLELLARACDKLQLPRKAVIEVFSRYDEFLGILNDDSKRKNLADLSFEDSGSNLGFQHIREIGQEFQTAVNSLFVEAEGRLRELTLEYAIF